MRRGGFTFIEVMLVVVLLGLMAGAVAWSVTAQVRRGTQAAAVGQIVHADRMARMTAEQLGVECVLRFDFENQRLRRLVPDGDHAVTAAHARQLPPAWRVERILLARASDFGRESQRTVMTEADWGTVDIPYSPGGRSATWAARLVSRTPDEDDQWLVVSGLTGQTTLDHDTDEVVNLFSMLATGRADAD